MKILIIIFLLVFGFTSNFNIASASSNEVLMTITANQANVYASASFESEVLEVLPHNTNLYGIANGDDITCDYDAYNHKFYYVKTQSEKHGYVYADFITTYFENQQEYPVFNAKVAKKDTIVYSYDGENYIKTDIVLEKGQGLYLYEGYKKKTEYTPVCFVKDNSVHYYYVKTKNVSPNGTNPLLFVGISAFLALMGIIFSLFFIKKKKKTVKTKKKKSWVRVKVLKNANKK